jgi:uncharacterized membrane protein
MNKNRLELFSDGVFAIVLTLLVLELKPPQSFGLAGLVEIFPALLVHAMTFAVVGILWMVHYGSLATVREVRRSTLGFNLAALFCVTLMPFGAKLAAESPLEPFGPSGLALAYGLYTAFFIAARQSTDRADPAPGAAARGRLLMLRIGLATFRLACAGLAWISPWFGYLAMASVLINLVLPSPNDEAPPAETAEA